MTIYVISNMTGGDEWMEVDIGFDGVDDCNKVILTIGMDDWILSVKDAYSLITELKRAADMLTSEFAEAKMLQQ